MSLVEADKLLARIEQLLKVVATEDPEGGAAVNESYYGALAMTNLLYGAGTAREASLTSLYNGGTNKPFGGIHFFNANVLWPAVQGALQTLRAEIKTGLLGSIERRATGEVLGDLLGLAKAALAIGSDETRNVAAVLAAAAYEDAIRKMGATFAGIHTRPDLADVLAALKKSGTLVGAPFTTAQSYLKFRNDALHADWSHLNSAVVGSCIAFVEHLLLQHFS